MTINTLTLHGKTCTYGTELCGQIGARNDGIKIP